ncbi:hypothetical protein NEMBOFW57_003414 [Staphylotrichum longicolle]|uniref:SWIM-type domain-containing protein n=1 Tax=Staphylotrichum longicolle TaxID=669026 RepID=A0AAD4F4W9_9PEZI|nr:hypothetical protein NEMBOFW57_003414 [Staphylotrichum longicolle]
MSASEHHSDASDWDVEEEEDEDDTDIVSSPAGFKYNISRLSPRTRQVVKGLFNQASSSEPPQISLELCGMRDEDPDGSGRGLFYAFQLHEVVPCSVRIGARDSRRFSVPKCECPDARYRHVRPCKHLIWLFDKISKQTLFDHDPDSELTLTELGYPEELGDPFDQISQLGLDILTDDLRCDTSEPDSDVAFPNPARIREAREMVAAVAGIEPCELDDFRPDLETSYNRNTLIRRGDLGATLFSLLLASHSLAEIEKLLSRGSSPLSEWARSSAARALVSILKAVVYHRDLYSRLIGDQDTGFVYSALDMLADQSQFIEELEEIMERIGIHGAPPSYVTNMRQLIARMRSHTTEVVAAASRSVPRSETPPMSEPVGAVQSSGESRSSNVRFITPELPASAMGRGRQGRGGRGRGNGRGNGRGSKRSVSRSSSQDSPHSPSKRARGA